MSEDPAAGIREIVIRHEGITFRMRFAVDDAQRVPLWSLQRRFAEAMIRLGQASSSHIVTYRQIQRTITGDADFTLPRGDGPFIELQGGGTRHVPADVMTLLLDALADRR